MSDKIKTSIMISRELWEKFKSKVGSERGLKALSQAIEEAVEEEVCEGLIIRALEEMLGDSKEIPLAVSPVKPRATTDAGKAVRELRELRY